MQLDEQAAVRLLKRGDIRGLEPLVRLHQVRAVRTAFGITGDRQTAEDVASDAFIAVYEHIGSFDERREFGPWFYRIVVNGALKVMRGRRLFSLIDREEPPDPASDPEDQLLRIETQEQVQQVLEDLPPDQRAVVVLRYYLDMSEAQIAETLGCPVGTVKWRMHAAKQRMHRGLEGRSHA